MRGHQFNKNGSMEIKAMWTFLVEQLEQKNLILRDSFRKGVNVLRACHMGQQMAWKTRGWNDKEDNDKIHDDRELDVGTMKREIPRSL